MKRRDFTLLLLLTPYSIRKSTFISVATTYHQKYLKTFNKNIQLRSLPKGIDELKKYDEYTNYKYSLQTLITYYNQAISLNKYIISDYEREKQRNKFNSVALADIEKELKKRRYKIESLRRQLEQHWLQPRFNIDFRKLNNFGLYEKQERFLAITSFKKDSLIRTGFNTSLSLFSTENRQIDFLVNISGPFLQALSVLSSNLIERGIEKNELLDLILPSATRLDGTHNNQISGNSDFNRGSRAHYETKLGSIDMSYHPMEEGHGKVEILSQRWEGYGNKDINKGVLAFSYGS